MIVAAFAAVASASEPWEQEVAALRAEVAELKQMISGRRSLLLAADGSDPGTTVDLIASLQMQNTTIVGQLDDHESRIGVEEDNTAAQSCITYTSCD